MRSRILKTTVLAAIAGAMWTQVPQVALRLRRLSLNCWFMGHRNARTFAITLARSRFRLAPP